MSDILPIGKSTTSGKVGVGCFQPPLDLSGELCISCSCIACPGSVKVTDRTCGRSIQTYYSRGTLLNGASLAFHGSQYIGRCSSLVSHFTRPHHGYFIRCSAQGSASLHLMFGCSEICVAQTGVHFLSLSGSGRGSSCINNESLPTMLE